jgi:hypothetical protein
LGRTGRGRFYDLKLGSVRQAWHVYARHWQLRCFDRRSQVHNDAAAAFSKEERMLTTLRTVLLLRRMMPMTRWSLIDAGFVAWLRGARHDALSARHRNGYRQQRDL